MAERVYRTWVRWFMGSSVLAAASVAPGCGPEGLPGQLEAQSFGDLSYAPALREPADGRIIETCGDGAATAAGQAEMDRFPYVQRVSSKAAHVLVTTFEPQAPELVLSLPDGTVVDTLVAELDPTATLGSRFQWVWALDGLEDSTLYCYELTGLTGPTGFRTAPEANTGAPVRFIAFGDSGTGGVDQISVFEQIMTVPFDLMVHTGDVAYGQGTLGQLESKHFEVYRTLLAKFPSFPVAGNHDYETRGAAPFRQVFALPDNGAPDGLERWFSFDWGDVHFVALDTQRTGAEQAAWLEADLARNELPWTVVYSHKPPYSNGSHGSYTTFRRYFGQILERYGVDLVLSGHEHNYERFEPINGIVYVVTGGGGNLIRSVGSSPKTAFSEAVLHFVYVEVQDGEMVLHAIDGSGAEFDSARITH